MSEHPTDAHCLFTFVFKQALNPLATARKISAKKLRQSSNSREICYLCDYKKSV